MEYLIVLILKFNPMYVGTTSILHDSEEPTDVGHCADPGCYSRSIKYSASTRQIDALSELSIECHQSIRVCSITLNKKNNNNVIFSEIEY